MQFAISIQYSIEVNIANTQVSNLSVSLTQGSQSLFCYTGLENRCSFETNINPKNTYFIEVNDSRGIFQNFSGTFSSSSVNIQMEVIGDPVLVQIEIPTGVNFDALRISYFFKQIYEAFPSTNNVVKVWLSSDYLNKVVLIGIMADSKGFTKLQ